MVWGVVGRGLRCFLPPTETWCFQPQITNASVFDGGAALHPMSAVAATIPKTSKRALISIDDVEFDFHRSVFGSAEHRTVPDEVACLPRREKHFVGFFLRSFHVQSQFANAQTMRDILAFEYQQDGFSCFERDGVRLIGKSSGVDFDAGRSSGRGGLLHARSHGENYKEGHNQNVP